jgi:uncharacterized membrane protein YfcA
MVGPVLPLLGSAVVGLLAGVLAGAFGVGGGLVIIPLLTLALGLPQHQAQAVTLAVLLLPIGLPAVIAYHRVHPIPWRLVGLAVVGFLPGVLSGSLLATHLPERPMRLLFVAFLLAAAWRLWPWRAAARPTRTGPPRAVHGLWIGLAGGALAGLFGVGGGIIMVPLLVGALGMGQHEAQGTSLAVMLPPTGLPGLWIYSRLGPLPWALLGALAVGFLVGAGGGAGLATRVDGRRLARAFSLFVLSAAVAMAWTGLRG